MVKQIGYSVLIFLTICRFDKRLIMKIIERNFAPLLDVFLQSEDKPINKDI